MTKELSALIKQCTLPDGIVYVELFKNDPMRNVVLSHFHELKTMGFVFHHQSNQTIILIQEPVKESHQ